MDKVYVLTYFPNTTSQMILGVYSSTEKVAEEIAGNEFIRKEHKPSLEELDAAMEKGAEMDGKVFRVQRFYFD